MILEADRFDIKYDASKVSVEDMLEAVDATGFAGRTVEAEEVSEGVSFVDLSTLKGEYRQLFDKAASEDKRVLLFFHGHG